MYSSLQYVFYAYILCIHHCSIATAKLTTIFGVIAAAAQDEEHSGMFICIVCLYCHCIFSFPPGLLGSG